MKLMSQERGHADHNVRTDTVFIYVELRQRNPCWIGFSLVV
jgi:hypothetical protein